MGKIVEQIVNKFDGGMTTDPRVENFRYAQLIKNLDSHAYPQKLVPIRDSENGDTSASTNKIQNFCVGLRTGTTYSLYGLGVVSGDTKAKVFYKDLSTGGSNDLADGTWTATNNNASGTGTSTNFNLFVYYKNRGLIYGARDGTYIWAYDPAGSTGFGDTEHALNYTNIAQGLVHSKDDILYIPYDNKIAKNNAGSWTDAALTLPAHLKITSISEYGNYLAIACQPLSGVGNSRVFLWDRDASNTVLTESIDWGEGNLQILEQVDGQLLGISYLGISTGSAINTVFFGKIVIRKYSGGVATIVEQFISTGNYVELPIFKQKVDSFLYFSMIYALNGTQHEGIWKLGRSTSSSPFAMSMVHSLDNTTGGVTGDGSASTITAPVLKGFTVVGDFIFMSYTTSGTFAMTKTGHPSGYSITGYYDTQIFNVGSPIKKKLLGFTVFTEPLDSGQSVTVGYRIDNNIASGATFTTILAHNTVNELAKSAVNVAGGANLPEFREIQFRITTTAGSRAITGYKFKAEFVDKEPY